MKYLLAAIEARQARFESEVGARPSKPYFNPDALKEALLEANEGLDEKSSTHEFVDTLERIVNEIKNTTEHSIAFLQKVRKTEAPDYYNVIFKPMDLATLQKRVKSNVYRTKKAFADDLDLIWSNCLTYNSHPSHPLRRSAETLRAKSNQLLEFITDPSIPTRPIFSALAHNSLTSASNSRRSTPRPSMMDGDGDDEGDAEGESDFETKSRASRGVTEEIHNKLTNGVNGSVRDRSASPLVSRSQTPMGERPLLRKLGRGPLGRRSTSPILETPFKDRPAIIRTPTSMQSFVELDQELNRLDAQLGTDKKWPTPPVASTSKLAPSASGIDTASSAESAGTEPTNDRSHLASLLQHLNPPPSSSSSSSPVATSSPSTPATETTTLPPSLVNKSAEAIWWETISSSTSTSALGSGVPCTGFVDSVAYDETLATVGTKQRRKVKGKGKALRKQVDGAEGTTVRVEKVVPLGERMTKNVETLQQIRNLHSELSSGVSGSSLNAAATSDPIEPIPEDLSTASLASFGDTGIPRSAFNTHVSDQAGRASLGVVSNQILGHAGFDGTSAMALEVLSQVAAEYIVNLGRTLRFYSDRYGSTMSDEQILLHTLNENGVASPASLETYVHEDIDRYGVKLTDLHGKLKKARSDQLEGISKRDSSSRDTEPELPSAEEGESRRPSENPETGPSEPDLRYPPPPPFIPLTSTAVDSQIGLLHFSYRAREKTPYGLTDDALLPVRPKSTRAKVPPSGKIALKVKRKASEEPIVVSKKKQKKSEMAGGT